MTASPGPGTCRRRPNGPLLGLTTIFTPPEPPSRSTCRPIERRDRSAPEKQRLTGSPPQCAKDVLRPYRNRTNKPSDDTPLRPRSADDEQVHRTTARRPRRDPLTEPPQVSDDNPFSEAQFKTLKYHPGFPGRFHDLTAAIAFCRSFFPWYNTEHRHAGIAMLTPDDVHHHRAHSVLEQRERTLQAAWTRHPERFVRGVPQPDPLPQAVWINPPAITTTGETAQ